MILTENPPPGFRMYDLGSDDTGGSWVIEFTAAFACRECKHNPDRDYAVCNKCVVVPSRWEERDDG